MTVVVSPSKGQSVLLGAGMPAAPSGRTYELWYIGAAGAVPAGTFDPDSSGHVTKVLSGSVGDASTIGVTVEPAGGRVRSSRPASPSWRSRSTPTHLAGTLRLIYAIQLTTKRAVAPAGHAVQTLAQVDLGMAEGVALDPAVLEVAATEVELRRLEGVRRHHHEAPAAPHRHGFRAVHQSRTQPGAATDSAIQSRST